MSNPHQYFRYRATNIPELKNLVVEIAVKGESLKVRVAGITSPAWFIIGETTRLPFLMPKKQEGFAAKKSY